MHPSELPTVIRRLLFCVGSSLFGSCLLVMLCLLAPMEGCGASYQSVYEGEIRFEHCYRIDEEVGIPLTQRRECWREWTQFYTYGQTRDRLEYALRRQRELTAQIENLSHPVPVASQDAGRAPSQPVAPPAPTSPFAAPPHVHDDRHDSGTDAETKKDRIGRLIEMLGTGQLNEQCVLKCLATLHACSDDCNEHNEATCRAECDLAFKNCGGKCFK